MSTLRLLYWSVALLTIIALASCTGPGGPSDNQPNANEPVGNDNQPSDNGNENENDNDGGDNTNDNSAEPASVPPMIAIVDARLEVDPGGGYIVYVTVQPTGEQPDEGTPYDPDSDTRVYVLLDVNDDPDDDDVNNIDFVRTALLDRIDVEEGVFAAMEISAGADPTVLFDNPTYPLYVRVSITDGENLPVHVYAGVQIEE